MDYLNYRAGREDMHYRSGYEFNLGRRLAHLDPGDSPDRLHEAVARPGEKMAVTFLQLRGPLRMPGHGLLGRRQSSLKSDYQGFIREHHSHRLGFQTGANLLEGNCFPGNLLRLV
jgi:hypothetical protein